MTIIHLPLLTTEILTDFLKSNNLCKDCLEFRSMVDNAIKSTNKCEYRATNLQFQNRFYSCELKTKKVMFIKGESSNDDLIKNCIWFWKIKNNEI